MSTDTNSTHSAKDWQDTDIGRVPSDWTVTTLGSIAKVLTDGSHFSPKPTSDGRYMASIKDMSYSGFDFSQCKRISEIDYAKLRKAGCCPQKGDILISKDGANCLDIIFVYSHCEEIVVLSSIAILRLHSDYSPRFYNYFLLSPVSQRIMRNWFISGSAIPRVVLKDFRDVPVPRLPLEEQEHIAAVLSCLDDKIELLRRQNETLEAIAQTIFKEWFVNFNFPDKNGKPYKDSGGKMIDSELGEIPEGWRVGKVGDEIDTLGGGTPSTKDSTYWKNGTVAWYSPTDLTSQDTLFSLRTEKRITEIGLAKSSAKLFPKYSLLMSSRATIGLITINTFEACTNQGFIVIVPNKKLPLEYLHGWLLAQLPEIKQVAAGSTFPEISKSVFRAFNILVPDSRVIDRFKQTVESIYVKSENNTKQVKTLSELRDTLLPKLMSGQVRVKE